MKKFFAICVFGAFTQFGWGQSSYQFIKQGNKELGKENFEEAEVIYRKALDNEPTLTVAEYNLGNTKYKLEDYDASITRFQKATENFEGKENKAHAYHNLGNSYLAKKEYEKSIEAYKESLKLVPDDMDTKYNLVYAQSQLKKEQEQQESEDQQDEEGEEEQKDQKQQNEENQEGDEQEEDEQGQNSDQENESEENQGEQDKGENEEQEKEEESKPKPKEGQLTKEQADQILQMLESEEGKLQEELDEPEGEAVKINIEKDW